MKNPIPTLACFAAAACFAFSALMIAGTGSAWFAPLMTWWGASMTLGFIVAAR